MSDSREQLQRSDEQAENLSQWLYRLLRILPPVVRTPLIQSLGNESSYIGLLARAYQERIEWLHPYFHESGSQEKQMVVLVSQACYLGSSAADRVQSFRENVSGSNPMVLIDSADRFRLTGSEVEMLAKIKAMRDQYLQNLATSPDSTESPIQYVCKPWPVFVDQFHKAIANREKQIEPWVFLNMNNGVTLVLRVGINRVNIDLGLYDHDGALGKEVAKQKSTEKVNAYIKLIAPNVIVNWFHEHDKGAKQKELIIDRLPEYEWHYSEPLSTQEVATLIAYLAESPVYDVTEMQDVSAFVAQDKSNKFTLSFVKMEPDKSQPNQEDLYNMKVTLSEEYVRQRQDEKKLLFDKEKSVLRSILLDSASLQTPIKIGEAAFWFHSRIEYRSNGAQARRIEQLGLNLDQILNAIDADLSSSIPSELTVHTQAMLDGNTMKRTTDIVKANGLCYEARLDSAQRSYEYYVWRGPTQESSIAKKIE